MSLLVQANGETFADIVARLREVVGDAGSGPTEISLAQAIEAVWLQMGVPRDFSVHAAERELRFITNQGGIPQTQVVKF